jgi:hypothetical protein
MPTKSNMDQSNKADNAFTERILHKPQNFTIMPKHIDHAPLPVKDNSEPIFVRKHKEEQVKIKPEGEH